MTAALLPPPPDWTREALCAETDPEAFFPDKGGSTREAKAICNGTPLSKKGEPRDPCPVREQCLAYALDNDERFGIYGGMSERERRRLRVVQATASAADRKAARNAEMRRLEASGLPRVEIARRVGLSYPAVAHILGPVRRAEPVPAPALVSVPETSAATAQPKRAPRLWTTAEQRDAIRTCTAAGMTVAEISAQLGISERTVSRHRPKRRSAA